MDPLDPALQSTAVSGIRPLLTLAIFAGLGSFFLGALVNAYVFGTLTVIVEMMNASNAKV